MESSAKKADGTVRAALLEYYAAPGKYQLGRREPGILFASIREVLLIAGQGRGIASRELKDARAAAHFFIRAAMLFPGADHYMLLGLPPKSVTPDLKEHYRLLIRLIHPDSLESQANLWPADAALRVNRAYEVLSSPVLRRGYDEQLAAPAQQRTRVEPKAKSGKSHGNAPSHSVPAPRVAYRVPRRLAWGVVMLLTIVGSVLLVPHQDPVRIVRKSMTEPRNGAQPKAIRAEAPSPPTTAPSLPEVPGRSTFPREQLLVPPETVAAEATPLQAPVLVQPMLRDAATVPRIVAIPTPAGDEPRVAVIAKALRPEDSHPVAPPHPPMITVAPNPGQSPLEPQEALPLAVPARTAILAPPPAFGRAPTLVEVQPVLSELLVAVEAGDPAQFLRLLDPEARSTRDTEALTKQYQEAVRGGRPVRLSQADFRGETRERTLLVTGRLRLHAGETPIGFLGERLVLRAEFVSRGGKIILMGLSSATD